MLKFKIYPELDFKREKEVREFQLEKLKKVINYVYKNSKFYQNLFDKNKIKPSSIKNFNDFQKIPLTTKEDLRKYNFDFICADKKDWVDVFATTGTTGERIYFPITKNDLARTAHSEYRSLTIAGIKENDIVQFTYPMSTAMWGAGISYYLGYQLLGACVLRYGPGSAEEQIENMNKLSATVVHSQAGFLAKLGMLAKEKGIMKNLKIRLILPAIENLLNEDLSRNEQGKELENIWNNARLCAVYGNTESASAINECEYKSGYHITQEFCYYEILNPDTFEVLKEGNRGILVITPLSVEGLPLLRYNLGDISFLIKGSCKCKRTSLRLGPILGRADSMIKIKGVAIFPSAIEKEIFKIKEIEDYYIEVYKDKYYIDKIRINIHLKEENKKYEIIQKLNDNLKSKYNITADIELKSKQEITERIQTETSAKEKRFFDLRKKNQTL